jgi:hypothetical protein
MVVVAYVVVAYFAVGFGSCLITASMAPEEFGPSSSHPVSDTAMLMLSMVAMAVGAFLFWLWRKDGR